MRLIDADAASLSTYNEPYWTESEAAAIRLFLVKQPTIDPSTLRPTGRWIEEEFENMGVRMIRRKCSECGRYEWQKEKYCHCGCKMEG